MPILRVINFTNDSIHFTKIKYNNMKLYFKIQT